MKNKHISNFETFENKDFEDAIPEYEISGDESLIALMEKYSTPQIFDAMAKIYDEWQENNIAEELKKFAIKIRNKWY